MFYDLSASSTIYISGPMSGQPQDNRDAFFRAEKYLRNIFGCEVLNPARQPQGLTYCEYMIRAIEDLDKATCVVFLPGYQRSIGAGIERSIARRIGLPIYFDVIPQDVFNSQNKS